MEKITKESKIEEVLQKYPESIEIFLKHGFHCLDCAAASFENIEDGAKAHGVDIETLIKELNDQQRNRANSI
jgi:hybrid cluster-associated redox disulfide protein